MNEANMKTDTVDLNCFDWDQYRWIELGPKKKRDREENEQPTRETQTGEND